MILLLFSDPDLIQVPPSVIATACLCSAVRGLRIASSSVALKTVCQLLNLENPESVEMVIKRIEAVFQEEAAAFQQSSVSSKGSGVQNMSTNSTKEEDTVNGHPETPTDIQDVHF